MLTLDVKLLHSRLCPYIQNKPTMEPNRTGRLTCMHNFQTKLCALVALHLVSHPSSTSFCSASSFSIHIQQHFPPYLDATTTFLFSTLCATKGWVNHAVRAVNDSSSAARGLVCCVVLHFRVVCCVVLIAFLPCLLCGLDCIFALFAELT